MTMRAAGRVLLMVVLGGGAAMGQSHDAKNPTALAPGINKGNVDSIVGPNYYYFYAGPGRWEVHLAFHEMGLLGQPYRQIANFDFTNPHGTVSHMQVLSQGNTGTIENHGDFDVRERMVLKVSGQSNLIRMGGYYEVTVTGVASFDGKAGSTAGVKAQQTESLVHSSGPLVQSSGPLVHSSGPLVQSSGPLVHSSGPLVKSVGPLVYPGQPLIVTQTQHEVKITLAADVLFDFGKSAIRPDAAATLQDAAAKIKLAHARGPIQIDGFTDAKGAAGLNEKLSEARAGAVEDWLIRNAGLSARELAAKGFGAARPVAANTKADGSDNPAGRQLNRRVEIVVAR